jgi:hypothetical protein
MARKPKRETPAGVALDAGQVTAIIDLKVVIADPLVFGTGSVQGDMTTHPKLGTVGEAVAEEFRTLIRAIATHLDCEVVSLGMLHPCDGSNPTVISRTPGRA